jgi:hypothetical protein
MFTVGSRRNGVREWGFWRCNRNTRVLFSSSFYGVTTRWRGLVQWASSFRNSFFFLYRVLRGQHCLLFFFCLFVVKVIPVVKVTTPFSFMRIFIHSSCRWESRCLDPSCARSFACPSLSPAPPPPPPPATIPARPPTTPTPPCPPPSQPTAPSSDPHDSPSTRIRKC